MFATFSILCSLTVASLGATPVILDTDLGSDIDDTWALCQMLGTPELDLKLIVTAYDDTPAKTRLVAKILEAVDRTDIPLATGKKTSDRPINQADWLGDYSIEEYPGELFEDGIDALIRTIHDSPEPVTLCVLGPQTNIGAALDRDPSIAENARVVSMAGSVLVGYGGKPVPAAEWNVRCDVEAIRKVLAAPWDITFAPLDSCGTLILEGNRYDSVAASRAPRAQVVMANYAIWTHRKNYGPHQSSVLFDTLAVYLCHTEEHLRMQTVHLAVDEQGFTVPSATGRPVRCAMDWTDIDPYWAHLVRTLGVAE